MNYGFNGGVMNVTNAKLSAESEKFALKIKSESGKLFTIGCHFPPKSTNFGTLSPAVPTRSASAPCWTRGVWRPPVCGIGGVPSVSGHGSASRRGGRRVSSPRPSAPETGEGEWRRSVNQCIRHEIFQILDIGIRLRYSEDGELQVKVG